VNQTVDESAEDRADLTGNTHERGPFKNRQWIVARMPDPAKDILTVTFTGA
jgi:hypothetical protein